MQAQAVLAALAAGVAAALAVGPVSGVPRLPALARSRWRLPAAVLVWLVGGAFALLDGTRVALLLLLLAFGLGVLGLVRRGRLLREADARRERVADYCEALLGELRAGQPTGIALDRAGAVWPEAGPVASAAALGAEVSQAMRRAAQQPGAEALVRLAGAWELCSATGTGLAFAVEQVVETLRTEQSVARAVRGELASARATARLVAVLPGVVLVAAHGVGASPWHFLLGTAPGLACLAAGAALALTGLAWIDRIAAAAVGAGA